MELPTNAINWFEIPVNDFERAKTFYSTIFNFDMPEDQMGPARMGFLPCEMEKGGIGGAIVQCEGCTPSDKGVALYLNGGEDLSTILNRVETAGGTIAVPKTQIAPEIGFFAFFMDTEGNKIGLHSKS